MLHVDQGKAQKWVVSMLAEGVEPPTKILVELPLTITASLPLVNYFAPNIYIYIYIYILKVFIYTKY